MFQLISICFYALVGVHVLFVCGGSEESSLGIDHAHEMELLLENYFMQAEELGNKARELKGLIDDSESVIFINLDRYRNVNATHHKIKITMTDRSGCWSIPFTLT